MTTMTYDECCNLFGLYDWNTQKCHTHLGMKIVGIFMVKNEEKIIERMLDSVKDLCDFIVITDTGSTDSTIDKLNNSLILHDLYQTKFTNFGESRTLSFLNALESVKRKNFELDKTFGLLLDADMILHIENKEEFYQILKTNQENTSFSIEQRNGNMKYFNTRLIRMNKDWKCVGPTHEYWSCTEMKNMDLHCAFIEDVNDGGCKSDKTERDIRLLEGAEINDRNTFYLAQSYNDIGQYDKANQAYLKRLSFGGWSEELFYSYYQLCKNACKVHQYDKMELYGLQAHFQNKSRREPLVYMMREFRKLGKFEKAYYYLGLAEKLTEPKNVLFSEADVYDDEVILFEKTILDYYLGFGNGLALSWKYLQSYEKNFDQVHRNMVFYLNKPEMEKIKLPFESIGQYSPSSCSILRHKNVLIGNARYVNYTIGTNQQYNLKEDKVRTKNYFFVLNDAYETVVFQLTSFDGAEKMANDIEGLEDVRLYHDDKNDIRFYANTFDYTPHVTVVKGMYYPVRSRIQTVFNTQKTEKNWFPFKEQFLEGAWKLPNAPSFYKHLRGSSPPVHHEGKTFILFHGVIHNLDGTRVYYHTLCMIESDALSLSLPFKFCDNRIEYCLSFLIEKDNFWFSCSENDSCPFIAKIKFDTVQKLFK